MRLALVNLMKVPEVPPTGLMYIATYLREYMGFDNSRIIDVNVEDVRKELRKYKPDVVGISSMTVSYGKAIELAKEIKQNMEIPCLIGGVHISTLPSSLTKEFDLGIIGEGEQTTLELVQLYEKYGEFSEKKLKEIKGVAYYKDGKVVLTERRELITPLDKIPIPDRSFLDPSYFKPRPIFFTNEIGREGHILTTRGCPYRCAFCSTSVFWQKVRAHSVERVCEEVKELVDKYHVDSIQVWDDLFTYNKKRLRKIAKMLKEEGITEKVQFSCQPRANLVDDELCEILKDINVKTVSFGFESGSDKTLGYLKKGTVTVEQNKRAIQMCKKHGFKVFGSLMFGSPGETLDDMKQTLDLIDFMKENGAELIWAFVTTPFPGTEIWKIAKQKGMVSDDMDWNELDHSNVDNPMLLDDSVSKDEFKNVFEEAKQRIFVYFEMPYWHRPISWMLKQGVANPKRGLEVLSKILKNHLMVRLT